MLRIFFPVEYKALLFLRYSLTCAHVTTELAALFDSIAYRSSAASMARKSCMIRVACARFRERMKLGTAIAASNAIIATTIMISTSVNPFWNFDLLSSIIG